MPMRKKGFLASLMLVASILAVFTSCQQEDIGNNTQNGTKLKYLFVTHGILAMELLRNQ